MKSKKDAFKENLLEGILEIVFTVIFFGIGAVLVHLFCELFKLDLDVFSMDEDLIVILGIVAFFVICAIVALLVNIIKKKTKKQ